VIPVIFEWLADDYGGQRLNMRVRGYCGVMGLMFFHCREDATDVTSDRDKWDFFHKAASIRRMP